MRICYDNVVDGLITGIMLASMRQKDKQDFEYNLQEIQYRLQKESIL